MTCTQCGYISDTFDPFLALSVPIPKPSKHKIKIHFFPQIASVLDEGLKIKTFSVEMERHHKIQDFFQMVAKESGLTEESRVHCMLKPRYKSYSPKKIDMKTDVEDLEGEEVYAWERPKTLTEEEKNCLDLMEIEFLMEAKDRYSYEKNMCPNGGYLINENMTLRELEVSIFTYFYKALKPEFLTKFELPTSNIEANAEFVYKQMFEESKAGRQELYTLTAEIKQKYSGAKKTYLKDP